MSNDILMEWLARNSSVLSVGEIYDNPYANDDASLAYRRGMRVRLFTKTSQWVYGVDLQDAIKVAMAKEVR